MIVAIDLLLSMMCLTSSSGQHVGYKEIHGQKFTGAAVR